MPVDDTLSYVTPLVLIDGTFAATRAGDQSARQAPRRSRRAARRPAAAQVYPSLILLPFLHQTITARRPTHR